MDVDHDHPFQSRHLDLDAPATRRRHTAAAAASFAKSWEHLRRTGRDPEIGVPFPTHPSPTSVRRWAEDLERANGTGSSL